MHYFIVFKLNLFAENIIQSLGGGDTPESAKKLIGGVLIVKAVTEEMSVDNLRDVFVGASDVVIPQNQKPGKRLVHCDALF